MIGTGKRWQLGLHHVRIDRTFAGRGADCGFRAKHTDAFDVCRFSSGTF